MYDTEQERLYEELMLACRTGDLDEVKYLLTSPELDEHATINIYNYKDISSPLTEACWNGHLEVVKYLLTSPELKEKADIHFKDDQALNFACYQGHLDVVKYLLTSSDLTEHAKLNDRENQKPLLNACDGEYLDIVKYLMESNDLKEKPDLDSISEAVESLYSLKKLDYIEYFIFNDVIDLTEMFKEKLLYWEFDIVQDIKDMLEKKELVKSLNEELNPNSSAKKKIKL
jgi:ankyrin repeat protein